MNLKLQKEVHLDRGKDTSSFVLVDTSISCWATSMVLFCFPPPECSHGSSSRPISLLSRFSGQNPRQLPRLQPTSETTEQTLLSPYPHCVSLVNCGTVSSKLVSTVAVLERLGRCNTRSKHEPKILVLAWLPVTDQRLQTLG